jgi:hypothetical protein
MLFAGCSNPYSEVPARYHALLDQAMKEAGENSQQLESALAGVPDAQKEAMAFLIAYMPQHDAQTLSAQFLIDNVTFAYKARAAFSWAADIPDSIFFNEVLPYASLNERRDNWREDFFNRFSKYVKGTPNLETAIDSVNAHIRDEVMVDYNTNREKPDQSPYESMEQKMASCSGLSILLTDAFRSVGIPSRIAGTPNWHDNRGNHNWCEVWIGGEWYFTEYYPSGLNQSWFLADAGKANADEPDHAIYASSYKTTGLPFPLVWDEAISWVPAVNVTPRYVDIYNARQAAKIASGELIPVEVSLFRSDNCTLKGDDRVAANIDVFTGNNQVGGGRTAAPTQDLNDVLTFYLAKDKTYTFKYLGANGKERTHSVEVKNKPLQVKLFLE